jgi:hypothetical protein
MAESSWDDDIELYRAIHRNTHSAKTIEGRLPSLRHIALCFGGLGIPPQEVTRSQLMAYFESRTSGAGDPGPLIHWLIERDRRFPALRHEQSPLLVSRTGAALSYSGLGQMMARLSRDCGVHVRAHLFRHTWADAAQRSDMEPVGDRLPAGRWAAVMNADQAISGLTAGAVLVVAAIAVVSFVHIEHLAVMNGQTSVAAILLPLSIDDTVAAASLFMLRAVRAGLGTPRRAGVGPGTSFGFPRARPPKLRYCRPEGHRHRAG